MLLLMHNKMKKHLFLQTVWLMEEMFLKFDASADGVARSSEDMIRVQNEPGQTETWIDE